MNPGMSNLLARERTRDLLASRVPRTPRPSPERSHGLIGRLRAARAR
jgi:hypothetical protein